MLRNHGQQRIRRSLYQLLGSVCVLCHQILTGTEVERQLCPVCFADLPWLPDPESPAPSDAIARHIAPLAYADAPRDWVLQTKLEGGLVAARVLGTLLAEALLDAYPQAVHRPDELIPVPLSLRRLVRRGHNQAALIGTPVARRLGLKLDRRAARRSRHTPLQPGLEPDERRRNVAGAFASRRCWRGETLAIVDDVVTTGATATALAEVLLEAGAGEVHLWSPTRAV